MQQYISSKFILEIFALPIKDDSIVTAMLKDILLIQLGFIQIVSGFAG